MNQSVLSLISTIMQLALQYAPQLAADVHMVIGILQRGADPTPLQQERIDKAVAESHKILQETLAQKINHTSGL